MSATETNLTNGKSQQVLLRTRFRIYLRSPQSGVPIARGRRLLSLTSPELMTITAVVIALGVYQVVVNAGGGRRLLPDRRGPLDEAVAKTISHQVHSAASALSHPIHDCL